MLITTEDTVDATNLQDVIWIKIDISSTNPPQLNNSFNKMKINSNHLMWILIRQEWEKMSCTIITCVTNKIKNLYSHLFANTWIDETILDDYGYGNSFAQNNDTIKYWTSIILKYNGIFSRMVCNNIRHNLMMAGNLENSTFGKFSYEIAMCWRQ